MKKRFLAFLTVLAMAVTMTACGKDDGKKETAGTTATTQSDGKDDKGEVNYGYECGIKLEKFNDVKEGDILECYEMVEEARS